MAVRKLIEDVYEVGAEHHDRELFDELIPLPDGTSYNAYVVKGSEKTVLLDTVDPSKEDILMKNLDKLGIEKLDHVISHHAEQDHSGSIPAVLKKYPGASVVTNSKCKDMLIDHLRVPEKKIKVMESGEELSLGDENLRFIDMPWVHWPETLVTYLDRKKVLFSCDFFGSHLATSNLYIQDRRKVYLAAKRYYAEIMMPFRSSIKGHLDQIDEMDIEIIAPSHGPIYGDPDFILDAYREWVKDETDEEVLVPYVSMHGSTEKMVEYFVDRLVEKGVEVTPFNLTSTDLGQLAMSLVDASTVVIGSPTVLVGPHPKVVYAVHLTNALRPKTKYASIIGSYGWGGRMPKQIQESLENLDVEFLEPVISKGYPSDEDFEELERLTHDIIERHIDDDLVD